MAPKQNFYAIPLLYCILLFVASHTSMAQQAPLRTIPFRYLVLQTIDIMRQMNIKPRKGVERDTPFIKYQIISDMGRIVSYFGAEQTQFFNDSSKRFRYYRNPLLVISAQVDSILQYGVDTTSLS